MTDLVFESTVRSDVLRAARPGTEWLSTGFDGGRRTADAAYNITVPDGWGETDLRAYVDRRLAAAGFETPGPALLTGVDQRHARRATLRPVEAIVTAGVSNPATLPPAGEGSGASEPVIQTDTAGNVDAAETDAETGVTIDADVDADFHLGTINIIVGTIRALSPGALANLVSVATEAKTATLLRLSGFSGTTSDAVIVGCDPDGEPTEFSGSATAVGRATRACVRDALTAALESRYETASPPDSVAAAEYGCETTVRSRVSTL